jgi:hypothetical protein
MFLFLFLFTVNYRLGNIEFPVDLFTGRITINTLWQLTDIFKHEVGKSVSQVTKALFYTIHMGTER